MIPLKDGWECLFFAIKIARLVRGIQQLNIFALMYYFKKNQLKKLQDRIKNDAVLAESKDIDTTGIDKILIFTFILKQIRLLILIASVSYFFAMIFKILLEM
jgi:hypothetical protein